MSRELIENISSFVMNPSLAYRQALRLVGSLRDGEEIELDPSHPFPLALEMSAYQTAGSLLKAETFIQKNTPNLAMSWDAVYRHMSDKDYYGIFALPNPGEFTIAIPLVEVINKLIEVPGAGYKKITIPKDTKIEVGGMTFRLVYPIDIRQFLHGELSVVYDAQVVSPIQTIPSNIIEHRIVRSNETGLDLLVFDFKAMQFDITTTMKSITPGTQSRTTVSIPDDFYIVRVFYKPEGVDNWIEMQTTFTEQVYDPYTPTAVIRVEGVEVNVTIPQIYITDEKVIGKLRVDVYHTKGPVFTDLGSYARGDYTYEFKPIDKADDTQYSKPLSTIQTIQFFSTDFIMGGRAALSLEQVRDRVIRNSVGLRDTPITPDQMETVLEDKGYEIVKKIDPVTDRTMLATRQLPAPSQKKLITAASLSIQTSIFNAQDLASIGTVADNVESMTILPETVFQNVDGKLNFVSKATVNNIRNLIKNAQSEIITKGNYFYTPFHYVLEMGEDKFDVRPYYLQEPVADSKSFVAANATTGMSIRTEGYTITKTETGYLLEVSTRSSDAAKALLDHEVFAQIAFKPTGEGEMAYLNGSMIGRSTENEYVFQFKLDTNWNVRHNDALELTGFRMFDSTPRKVGTMLRDQFHILYATSRQMDTSYEPDDVDAALGKFILPAQIYGIMHEKLFITFGQSMKYLWARNRTVVGQQEFERYMTDVYDYWEERVYDVFPDGTIMKVENGQLVYAPILHEKGDPKMNNGKPVIKHTKGSVRHDADGQPIPLSPRKVMRQVDFMLVDGVYWFSDDPVVADYRVELAQTLVKWITGDIAELVPKLLEKTKLYFYPKTTTGQVEVMYGAGVTSKISATQGFIVTLSVSDRVYRDMALREALEVMTITEAQEHLSRQVVSMSDLIESLKQSYERDVIDVDIRGLGGTRINHPVVTIINDTERLSLRKRLVVRSDDRLVVEEDITFLWVRHEMDPT